MCSRDEGRQSSSKLTFMTEEDHLLASEGLCRDPLCLPLFSFYDMFELLLKQKKTSRSAIKKKLLAFHDFLVVGRLPAAPSSLSALVSSPDGGLREDILSETAFCNANVIAMFAYVFGVRLQLFYVGRDGVLGCQYFGVKKKQVKRVFMSEDNFCLLKKILTKTNTFSTKICSDAECNNAGWGDYKRARARKEEHWNKSSRKSECIYKLKAADVKSKKVRRIDEELDSFDSMDDRQDAVSADRDIPETPLCSIEHSRASNPAEDVPALEEETQCAEPKGRQIDTERFLDDWEKDIATQGKSECPPSEQQAQKTGTVIAGVTHTNVDGMLKFYSEVKEYGFIMMADESEVFVHKADLVKQAIDTRSLAYYRKFYNIAVRFDIEEYQGKTNKHRKAINMVILSMNPICS